LKKLPAIPDDAVVVIKREGGVGFFPNLAAPRKVALTGIEPATLERWREALVQAAVGSGPSPGGRGDQRRFIVRVLFPGRKDALLEFVVAETQAPPEIGEMWKNGEA